MISISAGTKALCTGNTTYVLAVGGSGAVAYSVLSGGAGGSIGAVTGLYTAPSTTGVDRILATDSLGTKAALSILVGSPLELFCDILRNELSLANDQIFLWDQKYNLPSDSRLYVAVSTLSCKPFGQTNRIDEDGNPEQSVNMQATLSVDIMSRSFDAVSRKEEVVLALNSTYCQQQQEVNGFYVANLSTGFVNLSEVDGAAIPYRFNISVNIIYTVKKSKAVPYYDDFEASTVTTEP